jgi:hypothetical protein
LIFNIPVKGNPSFLIEVFVPILRRIKIEMAEEEIKNRVAESSLLQISPEDWYDTRPRLGFDIADYLFAGLVLKELDFRAAMKAHDWTQYSNAQLCIFCSADAIVPTWAYMLVSIQASPFAAGIHFMKPEDLDNFLFDRKIQSLDLSEFEGKKVIVKGCSKHPVPVSAFVALAARLQPVVQSLMFGEPCSNVPLYKKKKDAAN